MTLKVSGSLDLDKIASEIAYLRTHQVVVGFFGDHDPEIVTIASANEFGAHIVPKKGEFLYVPYKKSNGEKGLYKLREVNIPARPFIRNAVRDNRAKYKRYITVYLNRVLQGKMTGRTLLSRLGQIAQQDIQNSSRRLYSPKNAPLTIANKGSDNPLMDTGELQRKVTWRIALIGGIYE